MAQNSLVKENLTDAMIRAGAELTRKLDELRWPVVASLWVYRSEGNRWRLVFASPRVPVDGRGKSYEHIQTAFESLKYEDGPLNLTDFSVTKPEDRLISALLTASKTGSTLRGIRVTRSAIDGHYIEDVYIYRLSDNPPDA